MRQSSVIFGVLLLAFVIYITMRGQLPGYMALFKPKQKETTAPSSSNKGKGLLGKAADKIASKLGGLI